MSERIKAQQAEEALEWISNNWGWPGKKVSREEQEKRVALLGDHFRTLDSFIHQRKTKSERGHALRLGGYAGSS